ncbi:unnamed protein product [Brugia timori]|uniref:Uncharacterized protein n=1 Tax=Brugia timori TaxID=42155 RepID=A0A3P7TYG4_9BILA|nr:unnamed protein product [Brugia timori]
MFSYTSCNVTFLQDEYADLLRNSQSSATVQNVTEMTSQNQANQVFEETSNNWDTSSENSDSEEENISWSDYDQRLFETALQEFPKGTVGRWDKIANCVSSKTKQQCIERFKYLSEMVRQRKSHHKNKK